MTAESMRKTVTWLIRLLLSAVVAFLAFGIAILIILPRATHGQALTVLTGSMTPGIPVGSVVLVRPVDPGTLRVGDIATYQKAPGKAEFITHRIVKIDTSKPTTMFTFKGDANRGPDIEPVPAGAIRGKVWFHVPYLGAIRDSLHTKGGLAGAGMLLLAGYALFQFAGVARDSRRKKDPTATVGTNVSDAIAAMSIPDASEAFVVATFRHDSLDGLRPQLFAALLRAILVDNDEDARTCTVLLTVPVAKIDDTFAMLSPLEPVQLQTITSLPQDPEALDLIDAGDPVA